MFALILQELAASVAALYDDSDPTLVGEIRDEMLKSLAHLDTLLAQVRDAFPKPE